MYALWSRHAGAAARCSCKVLLEGAAVKVVCARCSMLAPLQEGRCKLREGAAATDRCCFASCPALQVLSARVGVPRHGTAAGCCLRVLLLERCTPLQEGAALRVVFALWGMLVHCAVLLEGAAVRVAQRIGTGMLVPVQGAAGWCCCVCFGAGMRVPLQQSDAYSGICAVEVNLGAATGCCSQSAVCAMKLVCWCRCRGWPREVCQKISFAIWSPCWRNFLATWCGPTPDDQESDSSASGDYKLAVSRTF